MMPSAGGKADAPDALSPCVAMACVSEPGSPAHSRSGMMPSAGAAARYSSSGTLAHPTATPCSVAN
jgi:hypothetical protein